jgi:ATP/maltotriose-dependent transcriptional regulator MalT
MKENPPGTAIPATSAVTAGLGEVEKRVLSYAASIGKEFDFQVLATAVEMEEEPLAEILERLVQHGILKELKGGDSYAFIREEALAQAYRDISSSRLRVIHKKIAEAYEKIYPEPPQNIIPEMGRQFYLGRVHDKSLLYNRYAASLAMSAFSPDVAIRYLQRAKEDLAALPGDHRLEESDVLKEIGEQYWAMGEDAQADAFYAESVAKLPEGETTLRALLLLSRATAAREMDKLDLTRQYCKEAISLLEKVGHKKGLALAHRSLARAAYREGSLNVGRKELETTISLLDPVDDALEVARCYIDMGNVHSAADDPKEQKLSIDYYQKAIQMLEALHDYRELARAHNNMAISLMPAHPDQALKAIKTAREYSEKTKDRRGLGWRLFNSVEIRLALGDVDGAITDNDESGRILTSLSDSVGMQQVTLNKGIIAQHRKSYAESETEYLRSVKMADALGYVPVVVEALVHLASLYVDWGKNGEAAKVVSRIQQLGESNVYFSSRILYENLKKKISTGPN